ncbi:two-component system response regulator [Salinimonas lutimaris]|uniref:two-component system response regulator n=1 Tax=Salinimonas lutimaris TaxID=914153 RepID=UPI0010BFEEDA|nr:EAL domain-containing protein [Salinimonas lutimaris]
MATSNYENDELVFATEETSISYLPVERKPWTLLVVDDDEEVHTVTRLALNGLELNGRRLSFRHAYTGEQACKILGESAEDIAVILLDVVMENDHAGLDVVRYLRDTLKHPEPRIILRTGQPGYAPEEDVIKQYDINDYKTKTELTRGRLTTSVITALRSYQQIMALNSSRLGLQKIIGSMSNLMEEHSVKSFCEGVIIQLSSLIGLNAEGVVCARAGSVLEREDDGIYVLGAAGDHAMHINQPVEQLNNPHLIESIHRCLRLKQHISEPEFTVLFLQRAGFEAAVFINMQGDIRAAEQELLEVFLSSVSIGYENVHLFHQLRNAAFRDWLTRLPNRNEFINTLERQRTIALSQTLALVDISHFSDINDGLGQDAGNDLLRAVALRLQSELSNNVFKARIGNDVFALLGPAELITPQIINQLFSVAFTAHEHTIPLSVSVGLCEIDTTSRDSLALLKSANIALNLAKRKHTENYVFYTADMEQKTTTQLELIRKLRADFADAKLELWFQPQVDLINEKVVGAEALLRWPDGDGGYISPAVFIPLAEYSGLIVEIGHWVIEEACRRICDLDRLGYGDLRIAVNISIPQFRDQQFEERVKSALAAHDCAPDKLELEITESVVMDEPQIVIDALSALKAHGVAIALDDFGTGFSSMSYLQRLPLDRLKVDRSFVKDVGPKNNPVLAETIVTLGNKLGLATIAEGVETREQASYMIKLGCEEAQGFLFARPMPFDDMVNFLAVRQTSH